MLENPAYVRFSRESCVELMCMKDIEQALAEKPDRAKTYRTKDPYGDEITCFECCPGVTIEQMKQLHEGKPLEYMKGPLMPYTAVVDPHTLEDLGGLRRGEAASAEAFIAAISRHVRALEEKHGKGCDARLWEHVAESQVKVDLLLGEEKLLEALALVGDLEKKTAREHETVKRKVAAARETVQQHASGRLDALEKEIEGGRGGKARAEAARLRKLLEGTPLAERAAAIEARTKP